MPPPPLAPGAQGESNRVISEHQLNRESSRSHAIFTLSLEMRTRGDPSGTVVVSKRWLQGGVP